MKVKILLIGALLALSANSNAEERKYCAPLYVWASGGHYALSEPQYKACLRDSLVKLSELGICVRVKQFRYNAKQDWLAPQQVNSVASIPWMNSWATGSVLKLERRRRRYKRPEFDLALIPQAITPDGERWISGRADNICTDTTRGHSSVAVVMTGVVNKAGYNRLPHCPIGIAHEIGHLMGASHDEITVGNLMSTNTFASIKPIDQGWREVRVLPESIQQVRSCTERFKASLAAFKRQKGK